MRKKLLQFTIIASILFLGACSNEELLPQTGRKISFTASMPDDGPSTRVALEQEGKNIVVTWEVGDEIQLALVQGTVKIKETTTVTSISNNGKTANFDIPIPEGATGVFTLYGVYGGRGINIDYANPIAVLPTNAGKAGTLAGVQNRKDVMLYFEYEMQANETNATVNFKHLGSLFSITANNIDQIPTNTISMLKEIRLIGVPSDGAWAYNSGEGGNGLDLVTKDFITTGLPVSNYISFDPSNYVISAQPLTVWGWYPIIGNTNVWPELQLQLTDENGTALIISNNTKPAKTPIAGMSYHFYATINADETLSFTNDQFVVVTP